MEFQYSLPVHIIFGNGKIFCIGEEAGKYGNKALIVAGKNSMRRVGVLEKLTDSLKYASVEWVLYDQIAPNPTLSMVKKGAEFAKMHGCHMVIGIGGGSVMDAAKGIAFAVKNKGDLADYLYNKKNGEGALPILLIPTTCGTGSEGNGFSVLTDEVTGNKKSLRYDALIPRVSIVDPVLMSSMPKDILAVVGFDALCHLMEAYVSRLHQPISDLYCLEGMRIISRYLIPLYKGEGNEEDFEKIAWASTLGGMSIYIAGVTALHGMEHPLSGLRDLIHGKGLAALAPGIINASAKGNKERYGVVSRIFGGADDRDCGMRVQKIIDDLQLKVVLSEEGFDRSDVDWLVDNCLEVSPAGMNNNPVIFQPDEIRKLYLQAFDGR